MMGIILNILGFLLILFFILLLAFGCFVLLVCIASHVGKIYSEISGKKNWLADLYDKDI